MWPAWPAEPAPADRQIARFRGFGRLGDFGRVCDVGRLGGFRGFGGFKIRFVDVRGLNIRAVDDADRGNTGLRDALGTGSSSARSTRSGTALLGTGDPFALARPQVYRPIWIEPGALDDEQRLDLRVARGPLSGVVGLIGQRSSARKGGELDQKRQPNRRPAGLCYQVEGGERCPTSGEHVVDDEHPLPRCERVAMHFDSGGGVLEGVAGLERLVRQLALLAHGNETGAEVVGDRAARMNPRASMPATLSMLPGGC